MRTEKINIYSFNELSEDAKQKAIENNRYTSVEDSEWYDYVYEWFNETYGAMFDIECISFSGFYSQGDGAMFEYSGASDKLLKEAINSLGLSPLRQKWFLAFSDISIKGHHAGHYYHERSCTHDMNIGAFMDDRNADNVYNFIELYADDVAEYIEGEYISACNDLYCRLRDEYEHLTSDEYISDYLSESDQEFTSDGENYI